MSAQDEPPVGRTCKMPLDLLRQATTSGESNTDRDGTLSHIGEVHALLIGLGAGLISRLATRRAGRAAGAAPVAAVGGWALGLRRLPADADPHLVDASDEPAYTVVGLLVGLLAGVGIDRLTSEGPP